MRLAAAQGFKPAKASLEKIYSKNLAARPLSPFDSVKVKEADRVRTLHDLPLSKNAEVIGAIKKDMGTLPPLILFELARRVYADNPQEAMMWYRLGFIRSRYDAVRCTDKTAEQGILQWMEVASEVRELMLKQPQQAKAAGLEALKVEKDFRGDLPPSGLCLHGIVAYTAAFEKKDLVAWHVSSTEWPRLREEVRADFTKFLEPPSGAEKN